MAHVGQKLALGAAGRLGLVFCHPQVRVRCDQFGRPGRHLVLQTVAVTQQILVPALDLRQHSVEDVGQLSHIVVGNLHRPRRIDLLLRDDLGGAPQIRDWFEDDALQPGGQRERQKPCAQQDG